MNSASGKPTDIQGEAVNRRPSLSFFFIYVTRWPSLSFFLYICDGNALVIVTYTKIRPSESSEEREGRKFRNPPKPKEQDFRAILNLTQHNATADQIKEGIENVPSRLKEQLEGLLTFPADYDLTLLVTRAKALAQLVSELRYDAVMIGGLPALMSHLERELIALGIGVCYARTERVSVDQPQADGSNKKVSVFRYAGLYWAWQATPCPYCKSTTCVVVTHGEHLCG